MLSLSLFSSAIKSYVTGRFLGSFLLISWHRYVGSISRCVGRLRDWQWSLNDEIKFLQDSPSDLLDWGLILQLQVVWWGGWHSINNISSDINSISSFSISHLGSNNSSSRSTSSLCDTGDIILHLSNAINDDAMIWYRSLTSSSSSSTTSLATEIAAISSVW